jgi:hypothetical protein
MRSRRHNRSQHGAERTLTSNFGTVRHTVPGHECRSRIADFAGLVTSVSVGPNKTTRSRHGCSCVRAAVAWRSFAADAIAGRSTASVIARIWRDAMRNARPGDAIS